MPALLSRARSFPDRITFDNPFFVKKIRILMKGAVNYYFGLYRVDFFVKNWTMVLKNTAEGQCNEDCWVVNSVNPVEGSKVKIAPCVGSIEYSENRELFTLLYDSRLIHFNSGLCVVSGLDKMVTLQNCSNAQWAGDGRHLYNFSPEGTISPIYSSDECIYNRNDIASESIESSAVAEATSEIADGRHNAVRAIDGNEVSYWASNPGDQVCTITLYFKQWESMNDLTLNWKYIAEEFDIFAYTLENGWRELVRITNNQVTTNNIKLNRINARAIQIKMNKGNAKYLGKIIYGLAGINISDGALALERKKCDSVASNLKVWQLDDQYYYYVGNKPPYMTAYNELTKTYLKLKKLNRLINMDFIPAQKAKTKAQQINHLLEKTNKQLSDLLNKIKKFKTQSYAMKNKDFQNTLTKFKQDYFYPYEPPSPNSNSNGGGSEAHNVPQIGSVFTAPGKDCWHIKQKIPFKKSGYYWIKPRCTKKALRVFCDFSIDGLGTSIYIWNSPGTIINTPIIDIPILSVADIQKQCALKGLFPIEIHNKDVVVRITQYLETMGYNLGFPLYYPLGYDWGCETGQCGLVYKSLNTKLSDPVLNYFLPPLPSVWEYNRLQKLPFIGLGWDESAKPTFFNLSTQSKIGGFICSTNEHLPPIFDPSEAIITCSDTLVSNANVDGSVGAKVKVLCPAFCAEKSESKIYGNEIYSDNSSICRAAIHSGKLIDGEGGRVMLLIGASYTNYESIFKNGIKSNKQSTATNKSFTLEKIEEKCPIDFFKDEEAEGGAASESGKDKENEGDGNSSQNSAEQPTNENKVTLVPVTPTKDIPFNNSTGGKAASYNPPKPFPSPVASVDTNSFISNIKMMEVQSQISNVKELKKLVQISNALNNQVNASNSNLNSPSASGGKNPQNLGLYPSTNPAKYKADVKKLAEKKEPCEVTTDICIKEIEDFRRQDYVHFKNFEKFGDTMVNLVKQFKEEYAFGVWPSKLSNQHFQSK